MVWWCCFEGPIRFKIYTLYSFSETKFIKIHSIIYGDDTLIWKINSVQHLSSCCVHFSFGFFLFNFFSFYFFSRCYTFLVHTRLLFFPTYPTTSTSRHAINNHIHLNMLTSTVWKSVCVVHSHHFASLQRLSF